MKVATRNQETSTPVGVKRSETSAVRSGDTIEVSITHQISIKGDDAWVKFGASSVVGGDEDGEQAAARVIDYVDRQVMATIKNTVNTVNSL